MTITAKLVLAADAALVPVSELSPALCRQVEAQSGEYALSRTHSRTLARIIDTPAAQLISQFRSPSTVAEALLRYCAATGTDPESTLEDAFSLLERLVQAGFLVPQESRESQPRVRRIEPGSMFGRYEIGSCLQHVSDIEIYSARNTDGDRAVLKLAADPQDQATAVMLDREAAILADLGGSISPMLLASGDWDGSRYLLLSWCGDSDCASVAAQMRTAGNASGLFDLCLQILEAYTALHAQQVIHSDIHPRNILVDRGGTVRLIDFGLSRKEGQAIAAMFRGGVAHFFEPEYAAALRSGHAAPSASMAGEQYAIAALLYLLITGRHYLDFSLGSGEMLRQICEDSPLPFDSRTILSSRSLKAVLARALAKTPAARFNSVGALASAFHSAGQQFVAAAPARDRVQCSSPAQRILTETLEQLQIRGPLLQSGVSAAPRASIMYGSAGVACALLRIACARQDASILSLADVWGERAGRDCRLEDAWICPELEISRELVGQISIYHTEAGVHFTKALIAYSRGDPITAQIAVDAFVCSVAVDPGECLDVTIGSAGTLLAASLLLDAANRASTRDSVGLITLGRTVLNHIWKRIDSWRNISECSQIQYTGMAHGWAGILFATLRWCAASGEELPMNAAERLHQLAKLECGSGRYAAWNWNVRRITADNSPPFAPGWCHGSAGHAHLWLAAGLALHENGFLSLAERAALYAAETNSGNLSLCCGLTGQAYAQLTLYRHSGDSAWLARARALADQATACAEAANRTSTLPGDPASRPHSLYYGEMGLLALIADLENPADSAMPAFDPG